MSDEPTTHEIEVLEMLNGERDIPWGGWVGACMEFLGGAGYATRGCPYRITQKGKDFLASRTNNGTGTTVHNG